MVTSATPVITPGRDSGTVTRKKVDNGRGAKVGRGLQQPAVKLFKADIDRHDHQRQIAIDDAQKHSAGRIDQPQIFDADQFEKMRNTARAENVHPGIGANQQTGPEWHHDQGHQQQAMAGRHLHGKEIGDRISDQQTGESADGRQYQRVDKSGGSRTEICKLLSVKAGW